MKNLGFGEDFCEEENYHDEGVFHCSWNGDDAVIVYLIIFNRSVMMNHFRHCTSRALLLGSEKLYKLSKAKPIWRTILLNLRRKRSLRK